MSPNKPDLTPTIDPVTAVPRTGGGFGRAIVKFLLRCMADDDNKDVPANPVDKYYELGNKSFPDEDETYSDWVHSSYDERERP